MVGVWGRWAAGGIGEDAELEWGVIHHPRRTSLWLMAWKAGLRLAPRRLGWSDICVTEKVHALLGMEALRVALVATGEMPGGLGKKEGKGKMSDGREGGAGWGPLVRMVGVWGQGGQTPLCPSMERMGVFTRTGLHSRSDRSLSFPLSSGDFALQSSCLPTCPTSPAEDKSPAAHSGSDCRSLGSRRSNPRGPPGG